MHKTDKNISFNNKMSSNAEPILFRLYVNQDLSDSRNKPPWGTRTLQKPGQRV